MASFPERGDRRAFGLKLCNAIMTAVINMSIEVLCLPAMVEVKSNQSHIVPWRSMGVSGIGTIDFVFHGFVQK
jgi:hypothetical protein